MSENELLGLCAQIVSAHLSNNSVLVNDVPDVIRLVYKALGRAGTTPPASEEQQPAVPIKKSIFPGYLVCLEDGMKMKMLKRHLRTSYNMTPEQYRIKWGLPNTYPMMSPNYAARRSVIAKAAGLRRRADPPPVEEGTGMPSPFGGKKKKPGPKKVA